MFPFLGLAPHASKLSLKICSVMNMIHIGIILIVIIGGLVDQQLGTYEVYRIQNAIGAEWHEPPQGMHAAYEQNTVPIKTN